MDAPVNIQLSPEEALKVLLRVTRDTDVDADAPVGGWLDEEPN